MDSAMTNVYVRSLPMSWDKPQLEALFQSYGRIVSSKVLFNPTTTASRGIGFVRFESNASATAAIDALNGHIPEGSFQALVVQFAKGSQAQPSPSSYGAVRGSSSSRYAPYGEDRGPSRGDRQQGGQEVDTCNLYICDIPLDMTKPQLAELCTPFGQLMSSTILNDRETGQSRGLGFARFSDASEAKAAIAALNGKMLPGASKPISVTLARRTSRNSAPPSTPSYAPPSYNQGYGQAPPQQYGYAPQPQAYSESAYPQYSSAPPSQAPPSSYAPYNYGPPPQQDYYGQSNAPQHSSHSSSQPPRGQHSSSSSGRYAPY